MSAQNFSRAAALVLLLASGLVWAGEPELPLWAGLPTERLAGLGLGEPTASELDPVFTAPLLDGGFVRWMWSPSVTEAEAAFKFQSVAAASRKQAPTTVPGYDEAVGDGAQLLVLRSRNLVLVIRSHTGRAGEIAASLLAAFAPEGVTTPGPVLGGTPTQTR
ncbi:hypothetical protein L6R49_10950 [Myxococcota bacterium]|nr:hypothetical protein [Myxococcota bacterium]